MTKYNYKGYEIRKITSKDWMIYKDGELAFMNGKLIINSNNEYDKNALTLKEAKSRIDKVAC